MRLALLTLNGELVHIDAAEDEYVYQVARRAARVLNKPYLRLIRSGVVLAPLAKVSQTGLEDGESLTAVADSDTRREFAEVAATLVLSGDPETDAEAARLAVAEAQGGLLAVSWDRSAQPGPYLEVWQELRHVEGLAVTIASGALVEAVVIGLQQLSQLRALALLLGPRGPTDDELAPLSAALPESLEDLRLSSERCGWLADEVQRLQRLRAVTLHSVGLIPMQPKALLAQLPDTVEDLTLWFPYHITIVAGCLQFLPQLGNVTLHATAVFEHDELNFLLRSLPDGLEEFHLTKVATRFSQVQDKDVFEPLHVPQLQILKQTVRHLAALRRLDCCLTLQMLAALLPELPTPEGLEALTLCLPAALTEAQADEAAQGLRRLAGLKEVTLTHLERSQRSGEIWRWAMVSLPEDLQDLHLRPCPQQGTLEVLAQHLPPRLRSLTIHAGPGQQSFPLPLPLLSALPPTVEAVHLDSSVLVEQEVSQLLQQLTPEQLAHLRRVRVTFPECQGRPGSRGLGRRFKELLG